MPSHPEFVAKMHKGVRRPSTATTVKLGFGAVVKPIVTEIRQTDNARVEPFTKGASPCVPSHSAQHHADADWCGLPKIARIAPEPPLQRARGFYIPHLSFRTHAVGLVICFCHFHPTPHRSG